MGLHFSVRGAVVTGASKGIGLAVTRTLLEEGAHVVAASRQHA
jgi:NAD(P)-dependent dehydrogenase (short-subunit alcohol dehydrogenase family)